MNYRRRIEAVMKARGLEGFRYVAARKEKGVHEIVYRVPIGYSYLDLEKQIDAFYAACGRVVELKDYAGAVVFRILKDDFKEVIPYEDSFLQTAQKETILVGFDRCLNPVIHSLRVPHLMIAGKSGYGKTDFVRWVLLQLIAHHTPEEIDIWIVDLKGFSFLPFRDIPHVSRIARDLPGACGVLLDAVKVMEERSRAVWDSGARGKAGGFKRLYVLIDEAYMISPYVIRDKERRKLAALCDEAAARISGTGRESGVGLIYCTQRPDIQVINPLVKANMDAKICFKTETVKNSEIVLDIPGAEKLPHGKPGRVLFSSDKVIELQVPYIGSDDNWKEVLSPYVQRKSDIDPGPGPSFIHDDASGPVFYDEWQPFEAVKRSPKETRKKGPSGREGTRGRRE